MTTWASASCALPATSPGSPRTWFSRFETSCWQRYSNGASPCTACTQRTTARRTTPRSPRRRGRWRLRSTRQVTKDYLMFPALSGHRWRRTLMANASANLIRNLWAYVVIFCGHFPDGAEKFDPDVLNNESKPEWYLRQMLGSANFDAGPRSGVSQRNLCYQIEHHLFPDLPSNRLRPNRTRGAGPVRQVRSALYHRSAAASVSVDAAHDSQARRP